MELSKADLLNPNALIGRFFETSELVDGKPKVVGPMKPIGFMYQDDKGFLYTRGLMGVTTVGKYFGAGLPYRILEKDLVRETFPPKK